MLDRPAWIRSCFLLAALGCTGAELDPAAPDTGAPDAAITEFPDAALDLGEPLTVPPDQLDQWVWIPIPEMVCADNTPAGVGVRFTGQSKNVVIWFQGNGVCYDLKTCTLFKDLLVGMGSDPLDHMWWGDTAQGDRGIFDRNDPQNPFRADNFVVLPHCALDGHTADKESSYPTLPTYQQRGFKNAQIAAQRIVATFPYATRVVVAGYSAGGIGATANYDHIAARFEAIGHPPPFLIADSGPLLRTPYLGTVARNDLTAGGGLDKTVFANCPDCPTAGPSAAYPTLAQRHPGVRASVISSYGDSVSTNLYRLLNYDINVLDGNKFRAGLLDLESWMSEQQPALAPSTHRSFYFGGDRHGALVYPLADTPGLVTFLEQQLSSDPSWQSVTP